MMHIPAFKLERYFAKYEFSSPYLLCCSDCESLAVGDLLALEPDAPEQLNRLWLGYTESQGHPVLRERIAELYDDIRPDQILVHTGAEEAIFSLMNVLLAPGDHVIVHYPCYQSLAEVARSLGCDVTLWRGRQESGWSLDLEFLKSRLRPETRLVVINCPHNPTGYVMAADDFKELVRLSQQHGFVIFSDEVYRMLEYRDRDRLPALCDLDGRGVSLGVMSKSLGLAGLRIGWIATQNRELYERMAGFKDYITICNSAPGEFLAAVALRHRDRLLERNMEIIRSNLAMLNRFFDQYREIVAWVVPKGGPIAFPAFVHGSDAEAFCRGLVEESGVLLLPGALYDDDYRPHMRIGFGRRNMPECLERLSQYLNRHGKELQ
jgi:aspartate/methionine/tyrosine aminotransferase